MRRKSQLDALREASRAIRRLIAESAGNSSRARRRGLRESLDDDDVGDIDITCTEPDEEIDAPSDGYVKVKLPFVGVYQSVLDSNIEDTVKDEAEWRAENEEEAYTEAVVDTKPIYRDIAEFTAKTLGFKTAVYAGADSPSQYNYRDDYIYVWVKRSELVKLYAKHGLRWGSDDIDKLFVALADANSDLRVEKDDDILYSIARAVYDEWYDGAEHNG